MRTRCFPTLGQRLLPRAVRIPAGPIPCCPVSPATAFALALARVTPAAAPPAPLPPPPEQVSAGVAVELCNFLHRIGLGVRELRAVEGTGRSVGGMGFAIEQMRLRLRAAGIEFADLTGHPWTPDRPDFEPTGKPRAKLGLEVAVIESCECPAVTVRGELVQKARGEAVRPPQAGNDD